MGQIAKVRKSEGGFTLIELIIVVSIVGVLSAIAIAQFTLYRKNSYDALAQNDLANLRIGEEALYASTQEYAACADAACVGAIPGFTISDSVTLSATAVSGNDPSFSIVAQSLAGSGKIFSFASNGP